MRMRPTYLHKKDQRKTRLELERINIKRQPKLYYEKNQIKVSEQTITHVLDHAKERQNRSTFAEIKPT